MKTLHGKVKIFFAEKGYGFIYVDGKHYYFNAIDLLGDELPNNGTEVTFSVRQETEGTELYGEGELQTPFAACKVAIKDIVPKDNTGNSVTCPHCGKKMVPRVTMENGVPSRSFCPFCGGLYKKFPIPLPVKIFFILILSIIGGAFIFFIWLFLG
jgi:cold shock CspA family protein/predicted RNA-binding Zn-ribbon protein involved in translation (DUF1610 family)